MSRPYTIYGTGLCTNGLDYEISRNPNAKKAVSKIIGKKDDDEEDEKEEEKKESCDD